ncbi:hypothetical protein F5Y15DRAFT_123754 [Xylariaceae sp. FL0016]|nr:hypothetical protein F5Y15DRAFT_123754 [Xylariaceae sp. FL0016]
MAANLPPAFPIIWREDIRYEHARVSRVFNFRRPSRYPVAVVEATKESHVVAAVRLANELGCRVSVRSGGHSWAAWSVREGAILIDLGKYCDFHFDEATGVLQASPSLQGRVVNKLLSPYGRFFPGGHCPEVGLGGFTLQGGMGWNCKVRERDACENWGFACERVRAIDVVTAEGKQRHCNEKENSDLFWAARGAGPGFPAIVTKFHIQTLPRPKDLRFSVYVYEMKDYKKAFQWILDITDTFDESAEIVAISDHPPGMTERHFTVLFVTFTDTEEAAKAALQPAQDTAPAGYVRSIFCEKTSLDEQYDIQHGANPDGHRYRVDNCYVKNDADVAAVLEPGFVSLPTPKSFSIWYSMAPGSRRSARDGTMPDMALSMQSDHYFATYVVSEDAADDDRCEKWVRDTLAAMQPHSVGAYLGDADFQSRTTKYWEDEQALKLMEIRKKWDPNGTVAGFLDKGDLSRAKGIDNINEWENTEEKMKALKL